ncbi:acetyltransferase, GNAT family [Streptococcus agalactiae H36B]|nr:acetyltransferase, GNAT family [Streptococcus agalactiae H36B]
MWYNIIMDIWTNLGRFAFIETEHVNLRPVAYTDREAFWRIASKRTNLQFIFPVQTSKKESDFLLVHSFMKEPLGVWAIEDKVSHKMFGVIRFETLIYLKRQLKLAIF